jgi:hypothetical protein
MRPPPPLHRRDQRRQRGPARHNPALHIWRHSDPEKRGAQVAGICWKCSILSMAAIAPTAIDSRALHVIVSSHSSQFQDRALRAVENRQHVGNHVSPRY